MNSKHALWWQAYVAALSSGGVVELPEKVSDRQLTAAVNIDHRRAVALADLGLAELEQRLAAEEPADEPAQPLSEEEKRVRAEEARRKYDETLHWSSGG